jgi:polar amino acid transport system substrate-binding protein
MGEALLKNALKKEDDEIFNNIEIISAGTSTVDGMPPSANSVSALRRIDIDISDYRSTYLTQQLVDEAFAISNFEGAKLVYQTGTTSQLAVEDNAEAWNYANKASFSQVMAALEDMKTATDKEFLIVDSQVAAQLVAEDNTLAYAQIEGMEAEKYGVVAKKGNSDMIAKVNAALTELLTDDADGKNQIEKWFDEYSVVAEDAE